MSKNYTTFLNETADIIWMVTLRHICHCFVLNHCNDLFVQVTAGNREESVGNLQHISEREPGKQIL